MCGISGIVNGYVFPMLDQQRHRGPDGIGSYTQNGLQLAHNRLAILDLTAAGRQPMETDRFALTYNGEIYNYKDLNYTTGNDARTLLNYIDSHGRLDEALRDINGMYAFGLYDKLEQKIHLVVDRMGQKPLYYTTVGETFAFASSPAALLHLKEKWAVSDTALQSYWKLGSVMQDSIWDGIKKVNASEHVVYNLQTRKLVTTRYWEPTYQENHEGIEDLVLDSIQKVRVSDVPVYIFLSGGLDSTTVASQFAGGNAIHMMSPELVWAQIAAKKFDINLKVVTPAECDPIEAMNDYCLKCGEPSMAALIPYITAKEAAKFCKVAVSANGADELFFGYDRTSQRVTNIQLDHIFRSVVDYPVYKPDIDPRLSSGRWLELITYVQYDLNKTLDFASMAHSLEVRSPFLDHRLVELALSIPQEQHGRKAVLKNMLHGMGFGYEFTGRPKLGFSLYVKPQRYDELQDEAYKWCIDEGWLKLTGRPGKRDLMYLRASAFGFRQWWEVWKEKVK